MPPRDAAAMDARTDLRLFSVVNCAEFKRWLAGLVAGSIQLRGRYSTPVRRLEVIGIVGDIFGAPRAD